MKTHKNKNGIEYYSTTNENGETIFSFSTSFNDIWSQEYQDAEDRRGIKQDTEKAIQATTPRSAWGRGVKTYALELLAEIEGEFSPGKLLNGAENWGHYSHGGNALIYDCDIAERLCSPSELKRKRGGELPPNSGETWLDCQARALSQAARLIANHA